MGYFHYLFSYYQTLTDIFECSTLRIYPLEFTSSDKRQATRKALLTAARELVSEKGHDRISVQDITGTARVARGTYYNYFETKQDVFFAVAEHMREEMAESLADIRVNIKDPAMLVSVTLKYYFHQVMDNVEWREFTDCAGLGHLSLQQPAEQCFEDIHRGVQAGRFRVDDVHFTQNLVTGMVRHVNEEIRHSRIGRTGIEYAIRSILQMLGLPDLVSKSLTQTPLPPIAAAKCKTDATVSEVTNLSDYSRARNS